MPQVSKLSSHVARISHAFSMIPVILLAACGDANEAIHTELFDEIGDIAPKQRNHTGPQELRATRY